jgi:hypothetical protein
MYALIRYPVGVIVEAIVLAAKRNRMRVVAAGFPDAYELRLSRGQWLTESGQMVEFEFLSSRTVPAAESSASGQVLTACFAGAQAS